jgi:hypothetical protein
MHAFHFTMDGVHSRRETFTVERSFDLFPLEEPGRCGIFLTAV